MVPGIRPPGEGEIADFRKVLWRVTPGKRGNRQKELFDRSLNASQTAFYTVPRNFRGITIRLCQPVHARRCCR